MKTLSTAFFVVLTCVGLLLFWQSFAAGYHASTGNVAATMLFPRILLGFWIVLAGGAAVESYLAAPRPAEPWAFGRLAAFMLVVGGYVAAIPVLGFLIASVVCAVLSLVAFGIRKAASIVLFGLLLPVSIWALFTFVVQIGLPTSPWFTRF